MTSLLQRAQAAVDGAQAAVDRAGRQLDRADSVTASMDELGTGMAELAGQVTALAGLGRAIASGPVGRVGALAYGVRHAVSLRRDGRGERRPHPSRPASMDRGELAAEGMRRVIRRRRSGCSGRHRDRHLRLPACARDRRAKAVCPP